MTQAEQNLRIVAEHIANEARDPAGIMPLYTPDAVLEFPGRGLKFTTPDVIEANYRRMFAAISDVELEPLDRFATDDRVVDDMIVRFTVVDEGMDGAPVQVGDKVALRLVHVFHMRGGRIAREIVHEDWQVVSSG